MSAFLLRYSHGTPQSVFPLALSADSRTFKQANGTPFPLLGFASWYAGSRTQSEYRAYIDDCVAKDFTSIELDPMPHNTAHTQPHTAPINANNDAPFTNTLGGGAWSGSTSYGGNNNNMPDFTTPKEAFWVVVDDLLSYAASKGVIVQFFPAYVGYTTLQEGWRDEMAANGATKMQTYGAWIASRYKNYSNLIWMIGGDSEPAFGDFPTTAESALITGLKSVPGQASTQFCAEWGAGTNSRDESTYGSNITINGVYTYYNWTGRSLDGYASSPTMPTIFLEGWYEDSAAPPLTDAPMRRYAYWDFLCCIAGYNASNTTVWQMNDAYASLLNSPMRVDLARLNALIKSIAWHRLIPGSKGTFTSSVGTLITAGGGSQDDYTTNDMVCAAVTSIGDLFLAYIGPGLANGSVRPVTVDMTKMRGTATFRWFDPTTGSYTAIGSFANTGTHVFTPPANHSDTFGDWVLRGDA